MDGWARGGAGLAEAMSGGGGGAYGKAYDAAMSRGHTLQKKLAEAKIATDEMNAREEMDTVMSSLFAQNPELGAAASTMLRGGVGGNFDQITRGGLNIDKQETLRRARDAAASGDMDVANAMLGVATGRPVERTKISGNTMYDPYASPDQTAQITPYGAGYLGNQRQGQVLRAAATAARGAKSPQDEYDATLLAAAEGMLSDAKLGGKSVAGLNAKDVAHALRTKGEFRDRDGNLIGKWDVPMADFATPGGDESLPPSAAEVMAGAQPPAPTPIPDDFWSASNLVSASMAAPPDSATPPRSYRPGVSLGPTPTQAMTNESVPDSLRAPSGAPVAGPKPARAANAAATRAAADPPKYDPGAPARVAARWAAAARGQAGAEPSSTDLPPQAVARLREGVVTVFGNGQRWTLQGGQPVRVQ